MDGPKFKVYKDANENMFALRTVLNLMKVQAEDGFKKGMILDPPCYIVYGNPSDENWFYIRRLDNNETFDVQLPDMIHPTSKEYPDTFGILIYDEIPFGVNVTMRDDDEILDIPDMSDIKMPWNKLFLELIEFLKERVSQFKKIESSLQTFIIVDKDGRVHVNATVLDVTGRKFVHPYEPVIRVIRGREEVYEKVKKDFDEMVKNGIEKTVIEGMKNNDEQE